MACFIYIQVLLILLGNCYLLALEGVPEAECPQPVVKKRTIIRAKESRENGAEPIGKFVVDSARQCYSRCCKEASCNVAIMYYKQVSEDEKMEKHCFLFDCKSPSVCSYDNHDRYAVIEVPKPMSVKKTTPKKEHEERKLASLKLTHPPRKTGKQKSIFDLQIFHQAHFDEAAIVLFSIIS